MKGKRVLVGLIVVLVMLVPLLMPVVAQAATTASVSVNATPSYVSITCNMTAAGYTFGVVAVSTNTSTAVGYFGITNSSSVSTEQTIAATGATWTGGTPWTHSDAGTAGADTAALYSSKGTGAWNIIVKNAAPNKIATAQAATTNYSFELRLVSPTSFSDGVLKTNTVQISAVAT